MLMIESSIACCIYTEGTYQTLERTKVRRDLALLSVRHSGEDRSIVTANGSVT